MNMNRFMPFMPKYFCNRGIVNYCHKDSLSFNVDLFYSAGRMSLKVSLLLTILLILSVKHLL